jgi:hypothetical protein
LPRPMIWAPTSGNSSTATGVLACDRAADHPRGLADGAQLEGPIVQRPAAHTERGAPGSDPARNEPVQGGRACTQHAHICPDRAPGRVTHRSSRTHRPRRPARPRPDSAPAGQPDRPTRAPDQTNRRKAAARTTSPAAWRAATPLPRIGRVEGGHARRVSPLGGWARVRSDASTGAASDRRQSRPSREACLPVTDTADGLPVALVLRSGGVADRLDVVAVGVADERAVVALVVLRP